MTPDLAMLPLWYAAFLLSITCHEAAHAWAAYRGGDPTAYLGGQVTLNPIPHIQREFFGTIVIPLITYLQLGWMMGWASAPYDPVWEDRHPRRAAAMAAAGPAANLILAAIALICLKVGLGNGTWGPPVKLGFDQLVAPISEDAGALDGLGRFLSVLFSLNLLLFVFNLVPLPPLDGSSVAAGLFEPARRFRDRLRSHTFGSMAGLLIAWYTFPYVFYPIFNRVIGILYDL